MFLLGDVHGKYRQLKRLLKQHNNIVQVGDLGVGFINSRNGRMAPNPPHYLIKETGFRAIRGNHDNPTVFLNQSYSIKDGHKELSPNGLKMMFIGGATSIDRHCRTEGCDWWPGEELGMSELYRLTDEYVDYKPDVMITHDCPESMAFCMKDSYKYDIPSRTRQAFEAMLYHHRPKIWVYGHWHSSFDYISEGTRFICLAELELKDIDI